ncbi:GGDEF domain-containing protein [Atopomonas sediminilitoris]|uniref:GGDEF domain-containing protein n=1 Tax=Atopomonas sediminilitoris TaxID=2919919 RepID=UPI001F4D5080|nr:GGDEF domain-containing protein [Atopomonas sediminilitoris]MCJ8169255.1 GGDEF domain-containing protein [Atopomonas sediminilitoris]
MAGSVQGNTIDFDTARLQVAQPRRRRAPSQTPRTLDSIRQHLVSLLQTSLEMERLLGIFFQEIQQACHVDALTYQNGPAELRVELGQRASHSASYRLTHESQYLGELILRRQQRFDEAELERLETLIGALLFPLRNALLYRDALRSALRDGLTGTGNRVALDKALEREVSMAKRHQQPLSALMVDLDYFKKLNDTWGHQVGDEALRSVADSLKNSLRNIDMVFRYGGEEFFILLTNTNRQDALMVAERVRRQIAELQFRINGDNIALSASVGCAALLNHENGNDLIQRADQALYQAKRNGRNQVCMAS